MKKASFPEEKFPVQTLTKLPLWNVNPVMLRSYTLINFLSQNSTLSNFAPTPSLWKLLCMVEMYAPQYDLTTAEVHGIICQHVIKGIQCLSTNSASL